MELAWDNELIRLLANEDGYLVLRHLADQGWCKASDVARELGIHTATAVKYLNGFYGSGVLERKRGKGRTRDVYLYRLSDPEISVRMDLLEERGGTSGQDVEAIWRSLASKLEKIYGRPFTEWIMGGASKGKKKGSRPKGAKSLKTALKKLEAEVGLETTREIVFSALKDNGPGGKRGIVRAGSSLSSQIGRYMRTEEEG